MEPRDRGPAQQPSGIHITARIAAHLLGAAVVGVLLWGFAILADEVPEQGWMVRADSALGAFTRAHGTPFGTRLFTFVSMLGEQLLVAAVVLAIIAFLAKREWLHALAMAITTAGGALLVLLLKNSFHRTRPDPAVQLIRHLTWSFPSGHAMNSLIGYGMLTVLLLEYIRSRTRRRALIVAMLALIGVIGASRVYLGAHFVSDVAAGWLAGSAWLVTCVLAYRFERRHWQFAPPREGPAHSPRFTSEPGRASGRPSA